MFCYHGFSFLLRFDCSTLGILPFTSFYRKEKAKFPNNLRPQPEGMANLPEVLTADCAEITDGEPERQTTNEHEFTRTKKAEIIYTKLVCISVHWWLTLAEFIS